MELLADCLERTGYRLPTEAEWEYACRAGAVSSRFFGKSDELLDRYAVYRNNAVGRGSWPVGSLKPNDLGLFDMLGNVAEWSHDEWLVYTPAKGGKPRIDKPEGLKVVNGKIRSQRGLTSMDIPPIVRSARRYALGPENRWSSIGFRVARTLR
jgi:formylglycine-generating enzyme required for sulfatase activity